MDNAQLVLFEDKADERIVCQTCGKARLPRQFAWADAKHTERKPVCIPCTVNGGTVKAPKGKAYSDTLIAAPIPLPPPPAPLETQAIETVKIMLLDERSGKVLLGELTVLSVCSQDAMKRYDADLERSVGHYTAVRNFYVAQGYQIAEIRKSAVAPQIEWRRYLSARKVALNG